MEVIKVENLYKQYRLGQVSTGSIAHDLNRWWHTVRGKEDPYEKITGVNNREDSGRNDYVWALQDINFSVKQGEVLGIIGRNGAGKSTLLKILSKVTSPSKGNIKVRGRIASLLEVGTGFHPELTGRENIFLNGAILGMTKSEIRSKFDEIVSFSGVEKYIDTPVKRYSSGMYVRLAFAVAAHLEPEILIVDEVLAVGDAEFQKKCLGKMKDVSGEGRTVLFVSHNMAAVKSLCTKGIVLMNGEVVCENNIIESIDLYHNAHVITQSYYRNENISADSKNELSEVKILNKTLPVKHDEITEISLTSAHGLNSCYLGIAVLNSDKHKIFTTIFEVNQNMNTFKCEIPKGILLAGKYSLDVSSFSKNRVYNYFNDICNFEVIDLSNDFQIYKHNIGDVKVDCQWFGE
jgi:lipopolysaccharide transport system ATP-binding protein